MSGRWPYFLKQLEEKGWDAERIGRAIGQPAVKVRAYRRGYVTPDRKTGLEIDRLVSCLHRHIMPPGIAPRIVVERDAQSPEQVHPLRGVYREEVAPANEAWYKIVTSRGRVGTVHLPVELADDFLYDNLVHRLNTRDPVRTLKLG